MKLKRWLIQQLQGLGIKEPTPVQENCIPPILAGKDCIGAAKTGSGKTLAFSLPILQTLSDDPYGIYALVLTPTRELATQIAEQFRVVGKPMNLRTCCVFGGRDMVLQVFTRFCEFFSTGNASKCCFFRQGNLETSRTLS